MSISLSDNLRQKSIQLRISGPVLKRETCAIREQKRCLVSGLTDTEAEALYELGRDLVNSTNQKSAENESGDSDSGYDDYRSMIQVDRRPGDKSWSVFVRNAVGVIGVNDLQILVEPKIPVDHFNFISDFANDPEKLRLSSGNSTVESAPTYLASLWLTFLEAVSVTLRADLHHDYAEVFDDPPYIRGRLDVRRTAINIAKGQMSFPATFEELSADNPVNRVLRAACLRVATEASKFLHSGPRDNESPQVSKLRGIAKRAQEATYQLSQAGDLRAGDIETEISRLAVHQERALRLAKQILLSIGRTIRVGNEKASCFLNSTPPIIEAGIRNLLHQRIGKSIEVKKFSKSAAGLSFNPDLVFTDENGKKFEIEATGDVKYRLRREDWPRDVLEQAVVFAEVFNARQGFFIDFDTNETNLVKKSEKIEGRNYHRLSWPANETTTPEEAADQVISECQLVLSSV
jgi:hypothetical protein